MTMNGVPVPPEGLDYIKGLEQWLEQYPNDVMVRSKLADLQRDPRFAEPDEPDDIMPCSPELAEFPVPPGLKQYVDATRIVAGASVPTSAACVGATFNLLAAEDIDVQSRANAAHPAGLYFVVGSESGWRKSASFREAMQGHVEADERVEALFREADTTTVEGIETKPRGFSPRAPPAGFHDRSVTQPAMEGPQDHGGGQLRRIIAPGRMEFPQGQSSKVPQPFRLPMGRGPDVHRPAQPGGARNLLLPTPPHRPDHGTGQCDRGVTFQPSRGQRLHCPVPPQHGPGEAQTPGRHIDVLPVRIGHHRPHARAGNTPQGGPRRQRRALSAASSAGL